MSYWGVLPTEGRKSDRQRRLTQHLEHEDLAQLLAQAGVPHQRAGADLRVPCPEHHAGTDRDVALRLTGERKGRWHCWYPGCPQKGFVDGLLRALLGIDAAEAEHLLDFWDGEAALPAGSTGALDWDALQAGWSGVGATIFRQSMAGPPPTPREVMAAITPPPGLFCDARLARYLAGPARGFPDPEGLIAAYGLQLGRWVRAGAQVVSGLRVFLPVWDAAARYRGWAARSLDGSTPKMLYPTGFDSAGLLYPEWQLADLLTWDAGRIVLVEGPFDALAALGLGVPAMATWGSKFSEAQLRVLLRAGVQELIFAYDGDGAGRAGMQEAWAVVAGRRPFFWVALPSGQDPGHWRTRADWEALPWQDGAALWSA